MSSFSHRRTHKRVEAAKRRARSELIKYGWQTVGYAGPNHLVSMEIENAPDTIQRVEASSMSCEDFVEYFEKVSKPVILSGLTDHWIAQQKWTLPRLYRKYRNQKFKCGEDDDGYSVKMKMKYYIDYMQTTTDDSPLYIFDSSFGERHKTSQLLEDYEVPVFFKDDLFQYAKDKRRPPYRWFVMGPPRSGTSIHIDPLGTSAWNALIAGHKKWCLIHPDAPKTIVKPLREESGKHPDEAVNWFNTVYRRVVSPSWYKEFPAIHAIQKPGDVMFVPSGWWHVVMNLDNTIAVTQNFCSVTNLPNVWPKTVKGRPKLSSHWLRSIKANRPELVPIIEEINRNANWSAADGSSSDSSSSSSSSMSSSSSDSGTELDNRKSMNNQHQSALKRKLDNGTMNYNESSSANECVNKLRKSPPAIV